MAVQTLDMVTPKPIDNKPKTRAQQRAEKKAADTATAEQHEKQLAEEAHNRPPTDDEIRGGNIAAFYGRDAPVVKRAGVAGEEPLDKKGDERGGFYDALAKGDSIAGFIASHGTWQKWVSTIKTEAGVRGVHETKMVPCDCRLCQISIKEKGWTF